MKYKVGDKVRVRKDLEVGKVYGEFRFIDKMEKMKGKIVTIEYVSEYAYELEEFDWQWTDEMLEPLEDIIEYKGKKYEVSYESEWGKYVLALYLKEHKEEILDEEEKEYLNAVIKPFRDKVDAFKKQKFDDNREYIIYHYKGYGGYTFPLFQKGTMYKGMELDKEYTLEQLGLDK